ncbi:hypothetical protein BY458DRAFT_358222 [Sporodiniella umbellata]|nr:hypothetical protein BY458DRAFT_358222 [Sporodiniella umbellata]
MTTSEVFYRYLQLFEALMYVNWSSQSSFIACLKWYDINELIIYLQSVREFIIKTPGKLALSYLPTLNKKECPVDCDRRFPDGETWVCEGFGEWNTKYDMLCLALHVALYPNRLDRSYPHYKTQGETECYCIALINDLLCILASQEPGQMIKRFIFEQRFGLQWHEKPGASSTKEVKQDVDSVELDTS